MYIDETLEAKTLRFSWVIEKAVAAAARPGRYGDLIAHLEFMKNQGIKIIINLCEDPLNFPDGYTAHFEHVHVPILDGEPPSARQLERILNTVERSMAGNKPCVIHCRGGVGRTATVLTPVLINMRGMSLEDAISLLRQSGRRTETMQQFNFLKDWATRNK